MEELIDAMIYCYRKFWDAPYSDAEGLEGERWAGEYYWNGYYFLRQRLLEELASR